MTGLSALNLPQPLVWILAFAIIFGLLAAFAHLLKRIAGGRATELEGGRNRIPRLGLVDSFDLDRHRKLLIVRRDNVEHLILVGPTDVVVESNIVRAAGAAPMREDRQTLPMSMVQPAPVTSPAGPQAQPAAPAPQQRELPIPPVPAVPQSTPASPTPPTAAAPVMPTAPFPIPQPVRTSEPSRKSTMPPPPPFGAPKRAPSQTGAPQRIEPTLTPIPGGAATPEKPAPVEKAEAKSEPDTPSEAPAKPAPDLPVTPAPVAETVVAPAAAKPAEPMAAFVPVPPAPAKMEATPAIPPVAVTPPPLPPKAAEPALEPAKADPALDDLSSKLQDVLKANLRPQPAPMPAAQPAQTATAPRPPLPPLPPLPPQPTEKLDAPQPAPKPAIVEIVRTPEPAPEAAPPAPPVDAFEEELRRILGRAPQKG